MICLLLQVALAPGEPFSYTIDADQVQQLTLTHDSLKYSFFVALESENSKDRFYGVLCKSASNYSTCNDDPTRCQIMNNTRTDC